MPEGLFIVDNTPEYMTGLSYLEQCSESTNRLDVATGFFECGALVALGDRWSKWKKIRILMGSETTGRTRALLAETLRRRATEGLEADLSAERRANVFLEGVPEIVSALQQGQIEVRIFNQEKFHAKAYLTHSESSDVVSSCLVGSSNFTRPGLTRNIELNVREQTPAHVAELGRWFERHWEQGVDITPTVCETVEPHVRIRTPFEVYVQSLQSYFEGRQESATTWEKERSIIWKKLDEYQREGYEAMLRIANLHGGAFLCDGVGLGKTFIGLMLLERLVARDRKKVVLMAPKAAKEAVWDVEISRYLPHLSRGFAPLKRYAHTDLSRRGEYREDLKEIRNQADAFVIDEAHFFRNKGRIGDEAEGKLPSMYRFLQELIGNEDGTRKQVFLLTATPINNGLYDFKNMIELFTGDHAESDGHFRERMGINSLRGHFRTLDRELRQQVIEREGNEEVQGDPTDATRAIGEDRIFKDLVVQRSREYVKESQERSPGSKAIFPKREKPRVAEYKLAKTYGPLLDDVSTAFHRAEPLLTLAIYYPRNFILPGVELPEDREVAFEENRQRQVVALIRTQLLKRFESSVPAFEQSCWRLMQKMLAFLQVNQGETTDELDRLARWKSTNHEVTDYVHHRQEELFGSADEGDTDDDEDLVPQEFLEAFGDLPSDTYDLDRIREATYQDLDLIAGFLEKTRLVGVDRDEKLQKLLKLFEGELSDERVLIFTEFADTARYITKALQNAGIKGVESVDSRTKKKRRDVIERFAPFYNNMDPIELQVQGRREIRVLISTDVLSEGLNLQDATRLINYDIHWNPVRLMQRIGRVDRRLNPEIEQKIQEQEPGRKRGTVIYWNFLASEIDQLSRIYRIVSGKTIVISKTLGVEGGALLRPGENLDPLQELTHLDELLDGRKNTEETMRRALQDALDADEDLLDRIHATPDGIFSGLSRPRDVHGVFLCYRIPGPVMVDLEGRVSGEAPPPPTGADAWSHKSGESRWYLVEPDPDADPALDGMGPDLRVIEELDVIFERIRCGPSHPRTCSLDRDFLENCRQLVERSITNGPLKQQQAPAGVHPKLVAWMELT